MADQKLSVTYGVSKRLKDMGDGTHAEVVAIGGTNEVTVPRATASNRSGIVQAAGESQVVAAENPDRMGFLFFNVSDTDMWISELGQATPSQPCFQVRAGAYFRFPYTPISAVEVICSAAGKGFTCREW